MEDETNIAKVAIQGFDKQVDHLQPNELVVGLVATNNKVQTCIPSKHEEKGSR